MAAAAALVRGTGLTGREVRAASVDKLKRLKELESENTKLERMYAELALENRASKDVLSRKRSRRPRNARSWPCWWVITECPCGAPARL